MGALVLSVLLAASPVADLPARPPAWPVVVTGIGVAPLVAGAVLYGLSWSQRSVLETWGPVTSFDDVRNGVPYGQVIRSGQLFQDLGLGLLISGLVTTAVGLGSLAATRAPTVTVAVLPGGGVSVGVAGAWR